ncbi:MAG: LuxR C-terminal-related transcriptional regulator [Pseudomonadota bacterium]|nr:LuxR C-terminal-related transcriptional regulator [Pseudomonadota bacterium]MEE3101666.1 LuxR C-terminal-related transcriptional regulator [Pseudomonadota bacterium]
MTDPDPGALAALAFREAPVAMMALGDRRILAANAAAARLFGWSEAELAGRSVRRLYPSAGDFRATGERWLEVLRARPDHVDERFMQARDGEVFWTRVRGRTLTPEAPFRRSIWSFERLEAGPAPASALTPREREIAAHVVNGRTSKEIARALAISPRTVEVHRAAILRKLGAKNAAELVSRIIVAG